MVGTYISETRQGRWGSISTHKASIGLATVAGPAQAYLGRGFNSLKLGTCASISSSLPKVVQTFLRRKKLSRVKIHSFHHHSPSREGDSKLELPWSVLIRECK